MSSKPKKGINKQKDEPKRHIVLLGKRNIVGVEDKTNLSEEYNNFVAIPTFEVNADACILLANDDAPYLCLIIIKRYLSRESLLPLIFYVLESFPIIVYKSNNNSNTFIIYVLYNYTLCVIYIYIIFYIFHLITRLNYNFHSIIDYLTNFIYFMKLHSH